jgi:hypothetical protein
MKHNECGIFSDYTGPNFGETPEHYAAFREGLNAGRSGLPRDDNQSPGWLEGWDFAKEEE